MPTRLVFLGRVGRPHGVDGEVYVDRTALTAEELLAVGRLEWRGRGGQAKRLDLAAVRSANGRLLATFRQVHDRETMAGFVNGELWGDAARLPDPGPGTVYTFQLVGLQVVGVDGTDLGVVRDLSFAGAQPLYVVEHEGKERLLPAYEPFLKKVDLAAGVITVELPAGLLEI